ncbi:MAG: hypothetical protein HY808_08200 [Nitrospirae bacterium]|nr:hypothetical protein [Nitrospirota bacterium]
MHTERDEMGYADGKGTWFILFIILFMALISISYAVIYFSPDLSNWLKEGADPDKIIWQIERGK